MFKNYFNFLQIIFVFILLLIIPTKISAQCAGTNGQLDLCTTISDPVNQSISLFSLLGGNPTPGGTWKGTNSRGLNAATGILNAQLISSGGTYVYTYTAPVTAGCSINTATVTVKIGAYAGVAAPYATVCSDDNYFNLFTAFNGTVMAPHTNGIWTESDGQVLNGSTIPVMDKNGVYEYTYTVPPVLACSAVSPSSTVIITVVKAPKEGTPSDIAICADTQISQYTDFDLSTRLSGQDSGGEWSGPGLTSTDDHNVNLEELYNENGPGEYEYKYKVYAAPNNKVCPDKTATIKIRLENILDFTGAKVEVLKDICETQIPVATYFVKLTQGAQVIPDGGYQVFYDISGPSGGNDNITFDFVNGVAFFPISSFYFNQVGKYTFNIRNIRSVLSRDACANIISDLSDDVEVFPNPRLGNATLTFDPTCQNQDAQAHLKDASTLPDGNYNIFYNVTGDNFALGQNQDITVSGGQSDFVIPASLNVNSGISSFTIVNITNNVTGCTNLANTRGNLIIYPFPNASTLSVAVRDYCLNAPVSVSISGLRNLVNAKISYELSGSNISNGQSITQAVTDGKIDFVIPPALLLNAGSTKITLTNLQNTITNCDIDLVNITDEFIINSIPLAPIVIDQKFCKVDEAVIANLEPKGAQYKWYNSATATTALADNYVLKTEDYYVRETSVAGCTSEAAKISVGILDTPAPLMNEKPDFCGLANPTIKDLSNKTNVASTVAWYDAVNGNLLASTTPLIHKVTYYGYDLDAITDCLSENHLEVTVSLKDCDASDYDFFIPDGFSPNGDNVNDTFRIPDIEFLYPNYTIEIYNRYGNGMYKGDSSKPAWDGKNYEQSGIGGGIAPNGVYFYVLHFNKDNKPPKQGRLYLNR